MALLELSAIGVLGFLIHQSRKAESQKSEEEHKRRTTPYYFDEGITEDNFKNIVLQAGRHIKRVEELTSDGLIVSGSFRSQSGLTSCDFEIDFNDYGHITGRYWISSENPESSIPKHIAQNICDLLQPFFYADSEGESSGVEADLARKTNLRKKKYNLSDIGIRIAMLAFLIVTFLYFKSLKIFFPLLLVESIILFIFTIIQWRNRIHRERGEIKATVSSGQLIGRDYNEAKRSLEKAGFTNIRVKRSEDLVLGILKKSGEVKSVSINGNTRFDSSDWFPMKAYVEITFHAFK